MAGSKDGRLVAEPKLAKDCTAALCVAVESMASSTRGQGRVGRVWKNFFNRYERS